MKHIRTLEEWKDIKGYEGIYQVSDLGRVRSLDRIDAAGHRRKGKMLKPYKNKGGYICVVLCKNGQTKGFQIHRLVAEAFIPNPDNLPQVNHCNERRDDNKAFNLEWCDAKYNSNYGTHIERSVAGRNKKVHCIETDTVYESITIAAEAVGRKKAALSNCLRGHTLSCGGFHWEYVIE